MAQLKEGTTIGGKLAETVEGAQAKADAAQAAAESYADSVAGAVQADLDSHKADGGAHGATSAATANAIIRRDSAGRAKVAPPQADDDIARKDTVDAHANATSVHGATSSATANRIVIRDSAGRAQFADPIAAQDAATKGYVDARDVDITWGEQELPAGTQSVLYVRPEGPLWAGFVLEVLPNNTFKIAVDAELIVPSDTTFRFANRAATTKTLRGIIISKRPGS